MTEAIEVVVLFCLFAGILGMAVVGIITLVHILSLGWRWVVAMGRYGELIGLVLFLAVVAVMIRYGLILP